MQKKQFKNIAIRASIALIIPILGQLFVKGWNWGVLEFVFAWIFFNILGIIFTFVTNRAVTRRGKIISGIVVALVFAVIWVKLATG